jgi:hypothetical protein
MINIKAMEIKKKSQANPILKGQTHKKGNQGP